MRNSGTTSTYPQPTHDTAFAKIERRLHPGWGWCMRCGLPWPKVKLHDTQYGDGRGCFPLCQGCWRLLGSPEARIEYYKMLIDYWEEDCPVDEEQKRAIQRAVANGG